MISIFNLHPSGVCTSVLKKICRENGLDRWPHRRVTFLPLSLLHPFASLVFHPMSQIPIESLDIVIFFDGWFRFLVYNKKFLFFIPALHSLQLKRHGFFLHSISPFCLGNLLILYFWNWYSVSICVIFKFEV